MPKRKLEARKNRSHERAAGTYDRAAGNRQPGRCILIVCEGAETEPNYFESLRNYLKLPIIQVKIKERAGAPISLMDEAQSLIERRKKDIREGRSRYPEYEAVWCVFDVENPGQNPTFGRAVEIADQNEFRLAVSNPAFEFWYILHFEKTTRPFTDGDDAKEYLKRHHIPGYRPAMQVFEKLVNSTQNAIANSRSEFQNHPQGDQRFPNPSTQVHLLVEELIEMSPSGREHIKLLK